MKEFLKDHATDLIIAGFLFSLVLIIMGGALYGGAMENETHLQITQELCNTAKMIFASGVK